ncbi:hypothetical protein CAPTEDRAFT_216385 [Capitella teleta]|uniref:SOCS box domain-containing protein n=1 Tax=Capitella teleta TaxID=283909 RepID=R7U1T6_CAPTE|nr:hypothetical protein CAPTEDRAFT_216385 [Capitella teleta]|eukprot:ELT99802.1 hypothetical protein CAPTEDRAFT_216385 [Capitella teleta]
MGEALVEGLQEAISYRDETKACQIIHAARDQGTCMLLSEHLIETAIDSNMEHTAIELLCTCNQNNNQSLGDDVLRLACRRAMSDLVRSIPDLGERISGIRKTGGHTLLQTTMSICNKRLEGTTTVSPRTRRRQEALVQGKVRKLMRNLVTCGDEVNQVMMDGSGRTALHLMCQSPPDLNTVRFLLCHGADPNRKDASGRTPLVIGLQQRMAGDESMHLLRIVEELLSAGADANIVYQTPYGQVYWPLHLAIRHSALVAGLLVKHGANVNAVDESMMSALFYAMFSAPADRLTILDALLSKDDLKLDLETKDGNTILHYSAKLNELADQVTERILRMKPESQRFLRCSSKEGSLPLHSALRAGNFTTAQLLLDHGSPAFYVTHLHGGNHLSCLQLAYNSHNKTQHRAGKSHLITLFASLFRRGMLSPAFFCIACLKHVTFIDHSIHGIIRSLLDTISRSSDKEAMDALRFIIDEDIHVHMDWLARYSLCVDIDSNKRLKQLVPDIARALLHHGTTPTLKQLCRRAIREKLSSNMTRHSTDNCDLHSVCESLPLPLVLQRYLCVVPQEMKPG